MSSKYRIRSHIPAIRSAVCFLLVCVCVFLLLQVIEETEGKTITVDDDGGADYEKVQDAVNASEDGDTIEVWEGVYYENVMVTKTLSLIGNGSANTTIDGEGKADVVSINAAWVNVSGFRFTGSGLHTRYCGIRLNGDYGRITNTNCSRNRYGIHLSFSRFCNVANNSIFENEDGIYLDNSNFNSINSNNCSIIISGIYLSYSNNNTIQRNYCDAGADGIKLWWSNNNTVIDNTCKENRDGISLGGSENIIRNNSCYGNKDYGIALGGSFNTIESNSCINGDTGIRLSSTCFNNLSDNNCSFNGGAGMLLRSHSRYNLLTNNTCANNGREGILFENSGLNKALGNKINGNEVGIGVEDYSGGLQAHNNSIYNNSRKGIEVDSHECYQINATWNYWGDDSGPYHSSKNPNGSGDNISDYVLFDPWVGKEGHQEPEYLSIVYVHAAALEGGNGSRENPFRTIKRGLDAAADGATIYVWEGIYSECVAVEKTLTLVGNGSAKTIIDGSQNGKVLISADGVTIRGFQVKNGRGSGIRVDSAHNNIFENNCTGNEVGISLIACKYNKVHDNELFRNEESGIELVNAVNNKLSNNSCLENGKGIFLEEADHNTIVNNTCSFNIEYYGIMVEVSSNNTFRDNVCTWNNDSGIRILRRSYHNVLVNNNCSHNGLGINMYEEVNHNSLFNNNCNFNNAYGIAISVVDWNILKNNSCRGNGEIGLNLHSRCNRNILEGNQVSGSPIGIRLKWKSSNNTLKGNILSGNGKGLYLQSLSENNAVHYNEVFNNIEYGIDASDNEGASINATDNWWGDESGPYHPENNPNGKGDNVTDHVIFDPWLESKPKEPEPPRITWYVDDDAPAGGNGSEGRPFNKIQDAVNASADGDTIYVWEGIYYENVVVNRTVNLIGSGSDVVTIHGGGKGDVVTIEADWCNMSGFRVDGSGDTHDSLVVVRSSYNRFSGNNLSNTISYFYTWGIITTGGNRNIIENNMFMNNGCGIYIYGSRLSSVGDHTEISNNNCIYNRIGISIDYAGYCHVSDNNCSLNSGTGIDVYSASQNTIENNDVHSNGITGINIRHGSSNMLINNTITDNPREGVYFSSTSSANLRKNVMRNNGIVLGGTTHTTWTSHSIDTSNTVNGKPVYYMTNRDGGTVPGDGGQIILANCSNMKVQNCSYSNVSVGITLGFSENNTIENTSVCHTGYDAVKVSARSNNNTFINNLISDSWRYGIHVSGVGVECWGNAFINNTFSDNAKAGLYHRGSHEGVFMGNRFLGTKNGSGLMIYGSERNLIQDNECYDNWNGIYLKVGRNTSLINNTCSYNLRGIAFVQSENNSFQGNILSYNVDGITQDEWYRSSYNNDFRYNDVYKNEEYGINASARKEGYLNATDNWWGNDSGPYHPEKNPDGKGDNVTDNVEFDPWTGKKEKDNQEEDLRPDFAVEPGFISLEPNKENKGKMNLTVKVINKGESGGQVEIRIYLNNVSVGSMIHSTNMELSEHASKNVIVFWKPPGEGNITIIVVLENRSTVPEENTDNNQASRRFTLERAGDSEKGDDESTFPVVIPSGFAVVVVVAGISVLLFIVASEPGRYQLFLFFLPLISRLTKQDIEKDIGQHSIRGRIYQYILDNPGANFSRIIKDVEAGNGTTSYHLSVLESKGFIKSIKSDFKKFYFKTGARFPYKFQSKLSFFEMEILRVLHSKGRMSVGQLASSTDKPVQTASYNINKLENKNYVQAYKEGRVKICGLTPKGERYLNKHLKGKEINEL